MRKIRALTEGWKQPVDGCGDKNLSLPLEIPAEKAGQMLILERDILIPADEDTGYFVLETRFLSGKCSVLLDGAPVREYRSVFAPRMTPLPGLTKGEPHTLRLEIRPAARPDGLFTFGAANLYATGLSHFALNDEKEPVSVRTVFTDAGVSVLLHAEIENPNNYDVVMFRLYAPDGALIDVKSARPTAANTAFDLEAPQLWDGAHASDKYRAQVLLQRDSDVIDAAEITFGIRDLRGTEGGFFTLNGIKLPLNGAFLRGCGTAADVKNLTELDANLVGLTALDTDEALLRRCDDLGLLVFFVFPESGNEEDFEELRALTRLLAQHPCAAALAYRSSDPAYAKRFCGTVKQNAQYIFTAGLCDVLVSDALSDAIPDLLWLDPSVSTEKAGFSELSDRFDEVLAAHPDYRFAVMPKAPECIFDRHSTGAVRPDCSQEYFSMWHARVWEIFSRHKNVACYFAGWLTDKSAGTERTGLTTCDGELRKDAYWFYKAQFSAGDFVKLASLPASVTKKTVDVKCYTNARKMTLSVNGKIKKKLSPVRLSESVYLFENVKLRRKNNTLVLSCSAGTDKTEVFRSKSVLTKR